ncbi:NUDIX hydrolase [Vibrio sinaloensis]|uniref:NUDIX hydrolase n=1 Tax=Photobacterium sp. (strain ATCC 43367) TaxID=379097 RepID=UPI00205FA5A7|nr:NUDIX hydrolase [Vibrio sinaloensis]UPQ89836.1 NUDIX hydrolase [Vibrio sinaloensis]
MKHLAMAVVIDDGKVLVQRRPCSVQGEFHQFPGGAVKNNETGTDAAKRELFEAAGITAGEHVATFSGINDFGGRIYYAIFNTAKSVAPKSSNSEFEWRSVDDLPLSDLHAADVEFVQKHLFDYCESQASSNS